MILALKIQYNPTIQFSVIALDPNTRKSLPAIIIEPLIDETISHLELSFSACGNSIYKQINR